jgi:hypothetical protein
VAGPVGGGGAIGDGGLPCEDELAVGGGVPIEIGIGPLSADGGLADLAGTADEGHLPEAGEVTGQDGVVDSGDLGHGYRFNGYFKLVNTKIKGRKGEQGDKLRIKN